jgi:hypothetical protein
MDIMRDSVQKNILAIIQITCMVFTFIIVGLFITENGRYIETDTVLQILLVAFLCAVPSKIVYLEFMNFWPRFGIHLLIVMVINIGGGYLFSWFSGVNSILPIVEASMVVIIFSIVYTIMYFDYKQSVKRLNKALEQFKKIEG